VNSDECGSEVAMYTREPSARILLTSSTATMPSSKTKKDLPPNSRTSKGNDSVCWVNHAKDMKAPFGGGERD